MRVKITTRISLFHGNTYPARKCENGGFDVLINFYWIHYGDCLVKEVYDFLGENI